MHATAQTPSIGARFASLCHVSDRLLQIAAVESNGVSAVMRRVISKGLEHKSDAAPEVAAQSGSAPASSNDHHKWSTTLGRKGQKRGPSNIRRFKDGDGAYKNRWDLLGLSEADR